MVSRTSFHVHSRRSRGRRIVKFRTEWIGTQDNQLEKETSHFECAREYFRTDVSVAFPVSAFFRLFQIVCSFNRQHSYRGMKMKFSLLATKEKGATITKKKEPKIMVTQIPQFFCVRKKFKLIHV